MYLLNERLSDYHEKENYEFYDVLLKKLKDFQNEFRKKFEDAYIKYFPPTGDGKSMSFMLQFQSNEPVDEDLLKKLSAKHNVTFGKFFKKNNQYCYFCDIFLNSIKESLFKKRNDSTWYDSGNAKESLTKALLALCKDAGIEVELEELEDKKVYHFVPENSIAYEDLVFINDRPDERYYLATAFEIVNYGKNFSVAELVFNNRKPVLVCRDFFESIYAYNAATKKWQNFFGKEKSDRSIRRKLEEADYTYKAKIGGRWLKGDGFANSKSDADEFESETEPMQRVNQMKKDGRIRKGMNVNIIKESKDDFDPIKDLAERIDDYNRSDHRRYDLTSTLLGDDGLQLTFEGEERDILDVMKKLYSDYDEAGEFDVIDDTFAYTCSEYDEGFVTFDIMKRPQEAIR